MSDNLSIDPAVTSAVLKHLNNEKFNIDYAKINNYIRKIINNDNYMNIIIDDIRNYLSEKYQIDIIPTFSKFSRTYGYEIYYVFNGKTEEMNFRYSKFETYNEALNKGILTAIEEVLLYEIKKNIFGNTLQGYRRT